MIFDSIGLRGLELGAYKSFRDLKELGLFVNFSPDFSFYFAHPFIFLSHMYLFILDNKVSSYKTSRLKFSYGFAFSTFFICSTFSTSSAASKYTSPFSHCSHPPYS